MSEAGVWLVTGAQAAGKSTVADRLARRFDRGVHIRGGQFYRWAVSGWAQIDRRETPEQRAHLDLRYRLSALVADTYRDAGFTAVVQDNIFGPDVSRWLERLRSPERYLVVLRPSVDILAQREATRHAETGKTAYHPDGHTIEELDEAVAATPRIGLWIDTSRQSPEQTTDEIWSRRDEARLGSHRRSLDPDEMGDPQA